MGRGKEKSPVLQSEVSFFAKKEIALTFFQPRREAFRGRLENLTFPSRRARLKTAISDGTGSQGLPE